MVGSGGLDKVVVRRYIRRQLAKVQYCFEKEMLANPNLSGTVDTQFLIQVDGRVSTVSPLIRDARALRRKLDVLDHVRDARRHSPLAAVTDVRYPFTLRTAGS